MAETDDQTVKSVGKTGELACLFKDFDDLPESENYNFTVSARMISFETTDDDNLQLTLECRRIN